MVKVQKARVKLKFCPLKGRKCAGGDWVYYDNSVMAAEILSAKCQTILQCAKPGLTPQGQVKQTKCRGEYYQFELLPIEFWKVKWSEQVGKDSVTFYSNLPKGTGKFAEKAAKFGVPIYAKHQWCFTSEADAEKFKLGIEDEQRGRKAKKRNAKRKAQEELIKKTAKKKRVTKAIAHNINLIAARSITKLKAQLDNDLWEIEAMWFFNAPIDVAIRRRSGEEATKDIWLPISLKGTETQYPTMFQIGNLDVTTVTVFDSPSHVWMYSPPNVPRNASTVTLHEAKSVNDATLNSKMLEAWDDTSIKKRTYEQCEGIDSLAPHLQVAYRMQRRIRELMDKEKIPFEYPALHNEAHFTFTLTGSGLRVRVKTARRVGKQNGFKTDMEKCLMHNSGAADTKIGLDPDDCDVFIFYCGGEKFLDYPGVWLFTAQDLTDNHWFWSLKAGYVYPPKEHAEAYDVRFFGKGDYSWTCDHYVTFAGLATALTELSITESDMETDMEFPISRAEFRRSSS